MKDEWKRRFWRKMLFFGIPGFCFLLIPIIASSPMAFPLFIPSFAFLIAIPMAELFSHFFPDFFHSYRWRDRPKPTLSIVRSLKKQGHFEEAIDQLREMARTDPQEEDIWLEMLETAVIDLRDHELGSQIMKEAVSALESQEKRAMIQRYFRNVT